MTWTELTFNENSVLTAVKLGQLQGNIGLLRNNGGTSTIYTSDGSFSKSAGASMVKVTVIGGGGGGAFVTGGTTDTCSGAGGGCSIKWLNTDLLSTTETVTVGSGGAGATTTGNPGSQGGTSSFGSHCSATGGQGGNQTISNRAVGGKGSGGAINLRGQSMSGDNADSRTQNVGGSPGGFMSGGLHTGDADSPGAGGLGGKGGSYDAQDGEGGIVIVEEYF